MTGPALVAARPPARHALAPQRSSLTRGAPPARCEPDAYASTDAHRRVADQLRERLFDEQVRHGSAPGDSLGDALGGGLTPCVRRTRVALYRPDGHFDRAICRLHLNRHGSSRFLALTHCYRDDALVACVSQEGVLERSS